MLLVFRFRVFAILLFIAFTAAAAQDSSYVPIDRFYAPPSQIPAEPGTLLKSEPLLGREIPAGSQAWRIQYTTSFSSGKPATAVATVLAANQLPSGPHPVIMWVHGTTGVTQACMPSLAKQPFDEVPALSKAAAAGWVIVATDYATEGRADSLHEYLIGEGEARSGLDSVRAAWHMKELNLDRTRTVAWGHSQGGGSALWVGIVGPRYAPDVRLVGIAAIAPVTDAARTIPLLNPSTKGVLSWYVADSYSHFYPDVSLDAIIPSDARESARQLAAVCGMSDDGHKQAAQIFAQFGGVPPTPDTTTGAFGARLKENMPVAPIAAPVLVAQGLSDDIIQPSVTDEYVAERCHAGQSVEYWVLPGVTHISIVISGSPLEDPLIQWTHDRFAGKPSAEGCHARVISTN